MIKEVGKFFIKVRKNQYYRRIDVIKNEHFPMAKP